jgi:hypothetical protein
MCATQSLTEGSGSGGVAMPVDVKVEVWIGSL